MENFRFGLVKVGEISRGRLVIASGWIANESGCARLFFGRKWLLFLYRYFYNVWDMSKNDKRDKRGFVWEKMLYFHSSFCDDHGREFYIGIHHRRQKNLSSLYQLYNFSYCSNLIHFSPNTNFPNYIFEIKLHYLFKHYLLSTKHYAFFTLHLMCLLVILIVIVIYFFVCLSLNFNINMY